MLEIIKSLKVKVKQSDVEQALIELIARQDPTIVVDSITFAAKRSGKDSIAVDIEAHFADAVEESTPAPEEPVEEQLEIPELTTEEDEAPFETEEEPSPKQSLFG